MKTINKSKQLDMNVKEYILKNIESEGYDVPSCDVADEKGKLSFLYTTFRAEYGWAIARYGEQRAFSEWLMGLPSAINIAFTNHDILQLAKDWGYYGETLTEAQENKILGNWWNLISVKAFQLFRKYKVC